MRFPWRLRWPIERREIPAPEKPAPPPAPAQRLYPVWQVYLISRMKTLQFTLQYALDAPDINRVKMAGLLLTPARDFVTALEIAFANDIEKKHDNVVPFPWREKFDARVSPPDPPRTA